ncbi:DNA polymerase III chi subunit [Paramagnetospirillum magnetotacticum MS-1]|uniref:DNA polymerase III chi subunit n=1 Tax=Paramagnetospirillum magnetotacticum MS-1 TaxID=272627 RepID=A0A0C2YR00_PARME|nr:DNA polymerase III subunit chi [Paramagnetospirillum magnetotacticum]KIL97100.1 DNA polymerase III chi subunit [Paramagnetospirillum magnetotacticum MS-1]
MTQIGFYHLMRLPLEQALPKLLDKALAAGFRAVVLAGSQERVEDLNGRLWTYEPDSWLPHGSARDGEAEMQPIWLTHTDENPNGATILVMCDGSASERVGAFQRCLDLFDGNDAEAVEKARERWKRWKAEGHELVYYQQTERGGWEEKSRT